MLNKIIRWLARDIIKAEIAAKIDEEREIKESAVRVILMIRDAGDFSHHQDIVNAVQDLRTQRDQLRISLIEARQKLELDKAVRSLVQVKESQQSPPLPPSIALYEALAKAYLGGITDGVAIAVSEPGSAPNCMFAPPGVTITSNQLWRAIDEADISRRGISPAPADTPRDVEGVMLRADQMRSLLRKKG